MTSIPGAPPCAFAGRHNYKAVGRLGHAEQDRKPFGRRPFGLSTATAEIGTGRRARGGRLLVLFNAFLTQAASTPVPFSEFRRAIDNGDLVKEEPVTFATTIDGVVETPDGTETYVATIPPGYVPPISSTTSARGAMRSTGSNRTR